MEYVKQPREMSMDGESNPSVERHKFNTRIQRPDENFDTFLGELKKLEANCEFAQMKDELIKDRIVCGVLEAKIKNRLLREKDLDLTKAMEICRAAEQTEHQVRQLMNGED
ncbi:hypothetical protein QE152_g20006 [Popillia japonica]|uniref:Uncharacterized protein n=1 Tax=Popillia japonica TaxID=7064 RepID=A0AAW1KQK2_POPJA